VSLKVIHSVASLDRRHGGPSRTVPALVKAMADAGVESSLAVWESDTRLDRAALLRADLVHDHGMWRRSNHLAATECRRETTPLVTSPRGMLSPAAFAHHKRRKLVAWRLYQSRDLRSASVIHATSEAEARDVRAAVPDRPIVVVPNGVRVPQNGRDEFRGAGRRALFLSRLHPIKGLDVLLAAWRRVAVDGWTLTIAGAGDPGYERNLRDEAANMGLNGRLNFVGEVTDDDKWQLYQSSDLFVLPTQTENFGLVIAEALASGLPVITTTAAPWNALRDERCGWWVEPTEEAFCSALEEAAGLSSDELREMGARGREMVSARFGWGRIAEDMAQVYEWVLGSGPQPRSLWSGS
jgi:glycosyltransferase involved in cell wall biosynthesis